MDGGELLKTSHSTEAEHRPLSSSERKVRVLSPIVEPATRLLPVRHTEVFHGGTIRAKPVRHEDIHTAMFLHCFPWEFDRGLLVARLGDEAFQHLAFMIDGPPEVVPLTVVADKFERVSARTVTLSLMPRRYCATRQERRRGWP